MRLFALLFVALLAARAFAAPTTPDIVLPRAVDPRNAALLALKREQIGLWEAEIARAGRYVPAGWNNALRSERARATQIQRAEGDAAALAGAVVQERAYFARNDGSPQPYYLALPPGYTPAKKYPLVVFLHGYSPALSKINPWLPDLETIERAQKLGFIVAMPYGRRNSDFVQWGEDDVMRVRAETTRLFSIDEGRIFLLGVSMGAYGAYGTGLHSIGQWAAIAAISGRTDFYLWFDIKRADLPPWKRILFDADDPRTLELNARNTPILVQHGALDGTVAVENSRALAADARVLGLPLRYIEAPNGSHFGNFQFEAMERALDWLAQQKPLAPPHSVTVIAGDLREASAHWAHIEALGDYAQMARLDASVSGEKVTVKASNVARFALDLPPSLRPESGAITLEVNGAMGEVVPANAPIVWSAPAAKTGKTPARTGPFKSLMRDPFALVYGDADDERAARTFAARWQIWADGEARVLSAAQVTDADKAETNLILFGTRATNPLIAQIADDLPLELTPAGYRIGSKTIEAKYIGLRMVWKSPWNEARLIGVCSGENWGTTLPVNHVWDLLPDYMIYDFRTETDGTNRALEAGFFDGNWALPTPPIGAGQTKAEAAPVDVAPALAVE